MSAVHAHYYLANDSVKPVSKYAERSEEETGNVDNGNGVKTHHPCFRRHL